MKRQIAFLATLLVLVLPRALAAQDNVVMAEHGKVEFIGLKGWTASALADTIRSLNPDGSLHACAADLKSKLGFPEAAAITYVSSNHDRHTVVSVVGPADSSNVQYLEAPSDSLPTPNVWKRLLDFIEAEGTGSKLGLGLQLYGLVLDGKKDSARVQFSNYTSFLDPAKVHRLWSLLENYDRPQDLELASWTLVRDANEQNRLAAAAVLANFHESDLAWWLLANTLRDPTPHVRSVAGNVLRTLTKHVPRNVDWAPAAPALRHLLRGTNLFSFPQVLQMLTATKVSPALQEELLGGGGELVLAHLGANHEASRKMARQFLVQLSGEQHKSRSAWREWIEKLGSGF